MLTAAPCSSPVRQKLTELQTQGLWHHDRANANKITMHPTKHQAPAVLGPLKSVFLIDRFSSPVIELLLLLDSTRPGVRPCYPPQITHSTPLFYTFFLTFFFLYCCSSKIISVFTPLRPATPPIPASHPQTSLPFTLSMCPSNALCLRGLIFFPPAALPSRESRLQGGLAVFG